MIEKYTTKVQFDKHGIKPITTPLWFNAFEKLSIADTCITKMTDSRNQVEYNSAWNHFVDNIQLFWKELETEGKKHSGFNGWIGTYRSQRKKDKLLQYLLQYRNQIHHGDISLQWTAGRIEINSKDGFCGVISKLTFNGSDEVGVEADSMGTGTKVNIRCKDGTPELPTVYNRDQTYPPPKTHFKKTINSKDPKAIAVLAINYYTDIYKKVIKKFSS